MFVCFLSSVFAPLFFSSAQIVIHPVYAGKFPRTSGVIPASCAGIVRESCG